VIFFFFFFFFLRVPLPSECFGPPAAASEMLRGFLNPTSIRGTIRSVCILAVLLLLIRAAQQQLVAHWAEPPFDQ
jgi:hypothetical protein